MDLERGKIMQLIRLFSVSTLLAQLAGATACGSASSDDPPKVDLRDLEICAPANGPFTLDIDNPYLPFPVGLANVLEGVEAGEHASRIELEVLAETEKVASVTTRVVQVSSYDDGELVEIARDYYAQAPDGTVCAFGSDADLYDAGAVVDTEGWRHGKSKAQAVIAMPGAPEVGVTFTAAYLPPDEVETSEITHLGETVKTPAGTFKKTLTILEEGPSIKKYAPGIGQIYDDGVELISF